LGKKKGKEFRRISPKSSLNLTGSNLTKFSAKEEKERSGKKKGRILQSIFSTRTELDLT
jgi:hypothetical protein